ncbi:Uncharacterised protein [Chromobacterium violaceum]|uniref:Uncharacterized protein n=1 Tax=Chromobacterium violaceum TaxID=536 RepID=A0A447TCU8_CHRVL|nr:Uncharacterised protein [Chromobacterium violaceum]
MPVYSAAPSGPCTLYWPVISSMKAVAEQTNRVSMYTENACTRPCLAGWLTAAALDACGPVPWPASLE